MCGTASGRLKMRVGDLLDRDGAWLSAGGEDGVVVSSRIRLARNLQGVAFPDWAGEEECRRVERRLVEILGQVRCLSPSMVVDMAEASVQDKEFLHERHLISMELSRKSQGSCLVVREDEGLGAMVNEEDHLRLQAMRPGFVLEALWREIDALDSEIEHHVRYAFSPALGYLTACPTNVGTGLRASVMVHVPALRLANEIEPIIKGLGKIGLAVRGLLGEGTEASGNMFQVSNQTTLGESEAAIIDRLRHVVQEVASHERHARERLMEQRKRRLQDFVCRAYGVLSHARMLGSQETLDLLSGLRLGIDLGMISGLDIADINRLTLHSQPGHLQKLAGKAINAQERDELRAERVRAVLERSRLMA